jgi:hypothetical protein
MIWLNDNVTCQDCGIRFDPKIHTTTGKDMWLAHEFTCKHEVTYTCNKCSKLHTYKPCSICGNECIYT